MMQLTSGEPVCALDMPEEEYRDRFRISANTVHNARNHRSSRRNDASSVVIDTNVFNRCSDIG